MKSNFIRIMFGILLVGNSVVAQEKFGKALNIGVGSTFYGYVGRTSPVVMLNYEFEVAKNFTLAPSIGFFTYTNHYYWGGSGHNKHYYYYPYRKYSYRQTVVPIGLKASYYFDEILKANKDWDFYAALTIGYAIRSNRWENDYDGDLGYARSSSLYADLHIGAEYHLNKTLGLFADLSTGMILIGLAVHH